MLSIRFITKRKAAELTQVSTFHLDQSKFVLFWLTHTDVESRAAQY